MSQSRAGRSYHEEALTISGFAPRWRDVKKTVTPADVLAKYAPPITDAIRGDMLDREFLNRCEAPRGRAVANPFAGKGAAEPADRPDHAPPDGRLCPAGLPEKQATTESIPAMSPV